MVNDKMFFGFGIAAAAIVFAWFAFTIVYFTI